MCLELQGFRYAVGEVRLASIRELQVFPTIALVCQGKVILNEGAGAANQEELHQFAPIISLIALFKRLDAADVDVAMLALKLSLASQTLDVSFWADAKVLVIAQE